MEKREMKESKKQMTGLVAMVVASVIVVGVSGAFGSMAQSQPTLKDGSYVSELPGSGSDEGKTSIVKLTIENGKITDCSWDVKTADGVMKSELVESGSYVMTEDGLDWNEQAKILGENVVANGGDGKLDTNEEGRLADADLAGASGVSINVSGFKAGVEDCLKQAKN